MLPWHLGTSLLIRYASHCCPASRSVNGQLRPRVLMARNSPTGNQPGAPVGLHLINLVCLLTVRCGDGHVARLSLVDEWNSFVHRMQRGSYGLRSVKARD